MYDNTVYMYIYKGLSKVLLYVCMYVHVKVLINALYVYVSMHTVLSIQLNL